MFADKITKATESVQSQERILVITEKAIYSIKGKKLMKRISLEECAGIRKKTEPVEHQGEFFIHLNKIEGYRFHSKRCEEIINVFNA